MIQDDGDALKSIAYNPRSCPYDTASFWSQISFGWLNSLFRAGYRRRLEPEDLYDVPEQDEARTLEQRLSRGWDDKLTNRGLRTPSLLLTVLTVFRRELLWPGTLIFVSDATRILQPYFVGKLISFFSPNSEMSETGAFLFAVGLGMLSLVQVFSNPLYFHNMGRASLKMRTAVAGLIYRKIFTVNSKSFSKVTTGKIINLLSTDIEKFHRFSEHCHNLWSGPVFFLVAGYCTFVMVGPSCFFALIVVGILIPGQMASGSIYSKMRLEIGKRGDRRVHMMSEILSGMRVIKMYCWEKPFSTLINYLRKKEVTILKRSLTVRSVNIMASECSSRLMAVLVFVGHWACGYPPIPLANVFMALGWLHAMRTSAILFFYYGVEALYELKASMKRVQEFISVEGDTSSSVGKYSFTTLTDSDTAVQMVGVSATWDPNTADYTASHDDTGSLIFDQEQKEFFSLQDLTFSVRKGELVAVVGSVGAGKSSLLSVLLKELPHYQGEIALGGSAVYASQQPWVFSGTLRDNILFGESFDRDRYETVIKACALGRDMSLMPFGDQTLVGERGLLLSGGQKARVNLARAVYRGGDVYLLDDPLSAVDVHVGKHIFDKCIVELLKGKTRLLVTHQLQYLQTADRIIVMAGGEIVDVGSYSELLSRDRLVSSLLTAKSGEEVETDWKQDHQHTEDKINLKFSETAEVLEAENRDSGTVSLGVYLEYFKAGRATFFIPCIFITCALYQSLYAYSDWVLAIWADTSYYGDSVDKPGGLTNISTNNTSTSPGAEARKWSEMSLELRQYIITAVFYTVSALLCAVCIFLMSAVASQNLHNKMFKFILGARTKFFDENPVGRIMNRFARDIGFLDSMFGFQLTIMFTFIMRFTVSMIITMIISPWLLIPVVPVMALIVALRYYAVQTTRDVRRLEGIARSPVYSHVSDTINGLQTIRAMKKEEKVYAEFVQCQNTHTSAWFLYICSYRWFSIKSILLLAIFINIVFVVCVALGRSVPRGLLAITLTYLSNMTEPFEFLMRISAEFENMMTSVERIVSYTSLDQEGPVTTSSPPPSTWPASGRIQFEKVSLSYSTESKKVLKGLNFDIKPNEKVGIVGRTGAGKSSLLAALFRLAEPEGAIIIDGIDVTQIGLQELRSKISVIPQDPVLFSGSLRKNLDPFEEFNYSMLWKCVDLVQLGDKIRGMKDNIDTEVAESGSNFSVGERQLICLARALLRRNKILVLDEATANVDQRTDGLIQKTIREQFKDCTVLTIAHRLHTVMDYDRIMVLDAGEVKELDVPLALLENRSSFLHRLVSQVGARHAQELLALAKKSATST